jgi:cell division protein DivIC
MKRRKSFVRRHIIAIFFLIIIAIYSVVSTVTKIDRLNELRNESEATIVAIEAKEMELKTKQYELSKVGDLDFVEKFAREKLKMVKPNEIFFQMMSGNEE